MMKMELDDATFEKRFQSLKRLIARKYQWLHVLEGILLVKQDLGPKDPLQRNKDETSRKIRSLRDDWNEFTMRIWVMLPPTMIFRTEIREMFPDPSSSAFFAAVCEELSKPEPVEVKVDLRDLRSKTVHNDNNLADSIRQKAQNPSTGAQNDIMMDTQRFGAVGAVYNGRPSDLTGPSISIYHPIFSKFRLELAKIPPPGQIPGDDLLLADKFIEKSLTYYDSAAERQDAIAPTVEYFLGSGTFRESAFYCGEMAYRPSGSKYVGLPTSRVGNAFVLLGELKNGMGLGICDVIDQAEKSYLLGCVNPESTWLRQISCMPAFLLAITGPYIVVCGAIYLNAAVSERLTDFIPLVPVMMTEPMIYHSEHDYLVHRIAHLFRTLRHCMDELEDECTRALLPKEQVKNMMSPAPHFASFVTDEEKYTVTYRYCLFKTYSNRTVFSADVCNNFGKTTNCIVKFTPRYCDAAHRIMYERGVAPQLLYCKFDPSVGGYCVVMERIQEQEATGRPQVSKNGFDKLKEALSELHRNSYVFGNLRGDNIVVDANGWPYLVGFNRSGKQGQVTYPINMNMNFPWVKGVRGGHHIDPEHDDGMLEVFSKEIDLI